MIWHTHVWKLELSRTASRLRARMSQRRYPEASLANLEKEIFLAFYIIRKLLDSHQISDRVRLSPIRLSSYSAKGKPVTYMNLNNVDELYEFDRERRDHLSLRELCNQVIHSYIFVPTFRIRGKLDAVLISSEKRRNDRLYCLKLEEAVRLFERIAIEEIVASKATFDAEKQDYKICLA